MTHTIQSHIPYWKLQVIKGTKLRENFLLYHVMKALLSGSVGMESEQAIEALHPKMNRWSTAFASVAMMCIVLQQLQKRSGCKAHHHCHNHDSKGNANAPSVAEMHTIRENAQTHRSARLH